MLEETIPDPTFEIRREVVTRLQSEVAQRLRELADRIDAGTLEARMMEGLFATADVGSSNGQRVLRHTGEETLRLTMVDLQKQAEFHVARTAAGRSVR